MDEKVKGPAPVLTAKQVERWRWIIAFSCAGMNFFHRGLIRSMAVVYVQLIQTFGITREEAALPLSLVAVISGCSGLSVGILTHYLNDRLLVVLGTLVSSLGLILCYTATNITQVNVYYSISQGLGGGLVFTLTAVILNNVFKKNRATASGINLSGPTLVSFIFPILFQYCSQKYGLRGAFLIAGGFTLNALPAALLQSNKLRRPPEANKEVSEAEVISNPRYDCEINMTGSTFTLADVPGSTSDIPSKVLAARNAARNLRQGCKDSVVEKEKLLESKILDDKRNPLILNNAGSLIVSGGEKDGQQVLTRSITKNLLCGSKEVLPEQKKSANTNNNPPAPSIMQAAQDAQSVIQRSGTKNSRPVSRDFSAEKEKLLDSQLSDKKPTMLIANGTTAPNSRKDQEVPVDYPEAFNSVDRPPSIPKVKGKLPSMNDKLSKVRGVLEMFQELLSSPYFILVCLSQISHVFTHGTFITIIIDYAKDHGIPPDQGIYILLANSVGDLIGRLGLGWISDKKLIERRNMMVFNYLVTGVLMHIAPYCYTYTSLTILAVTMALSGGSTITLFSVLFLEYLGIRLMPLAYGLSNCITGNATFFRPRLIGYYRDAAGEYDDFFRLLGSFQLFVSFLWLLACFYERNKANKNKKGTDCPKGMV
ncbi:uncharacterized protein LOC135371247 isoform X2 [Ornithodoros turicata]|uniref:uncharacterized protein LOC135371247 isoform X2 n=1 Tax=Ornithodoros turicata TaxID=34597 RepID=UPI00313A3AEA